jgi:desulfoferrodoxin-like iron-binding protein
MVMRSATQSLQPHCCNQPMEPLARARKVLRCAVCGSEVAVLHGEAGPLELICCHEPMRERPAPVAEAA